MEWKQKESWQMRKKKAAEDAEHCVMAEYCSYNFSLRRGQILGTPKQPFSVVRISVLVQGITRLGILPLQSVQRLVCLKCLALPQSFQMPPKCN